MEVRWGWWKKEKKKQSTLEAFSLSLLMSSALYLCNGSLLPVNFSKLNLVCIHMRLMEGKLSSYKTNPFVRLVKKSRKISLAVSRCSWCSCMLWTKGFSGFLQCYFQCKQRYNLLLINKPRTVALVSLTCFCIVRSRALLASDVSSAGDAICHRVAD